mmetsp:Transcript_14653/g.37083  ORF Transcript_14653/g.37083 Transcript_14653/m.37083 type:complete len:410 (-) Transcript_14653:465-1694(-)
MARAVLHLVSEREPRICFDVNVLDIFHLGQFVEVCRKHAAAVHFFHQVLTDGPRQPQAIICRGPTPQLVDDHQASGSGTFQDCRRFEHLGHERAHASHLAVPSTHSRVDGVPHGYLRLFTGHKGPHLGHQHNGPNLPDEGALSPHVGSCDQLKPAFFPLDHIAVVGNEVHALLYFHTRMPASAEDDSLCVHGKDLRLHVLPRSTHRHLGKASKSVYFGQYLADGLPHMNIRMCHTNDGIHKLPLFFLVSGGSPVQAFRRISQGLVCKLGPILSRFQHEVPRLELLPHHLFLLLGNPAAPHALVVEPVPLELDALLQNQSEVIRYALGQLVDLTFDLLLLLVECEEIFTVLRANQKLLRNAIQVYSSLEQLLKFQQVGSTVVLLQLIGVSRRNQCGVRTTASPQSFFDKR